MYAAPATIEHEPAGYLADEARDEDGMLTVGDLCRMFEESEEASEDARKLSERDRDFHDNKQLTEDMISELRKRGQPEVVINLIKRKVDFLVGIEKQQRTMPRALPRTPVHEQDATSVTDALRYVADKEDYQAIRSAIWRNLLVEGTGACSVTVEPKPVGKQAMMSTTAMNPMGMQAEMDIKIRHFPWDRFFADPHSSRLDFSDANYLGTVLWMDLVDAQKMYPENLDDIEHTIDSGTYSDTYEDTPKWKVWADKKRRRVRIVQIWVRRAGEWYFAEFTKGGILKAGVSPFVKDDGTTDCELIAQSAYVDRENQRFGAVREMISPQEEVNKRRSKALHLLNTAQTIYEDGAVQDEAEMARQVVRPDGRIKLNPGMIDKFKFETRTDLATGQFQLLKEAKDEIEMMGPNASMQGDNGDTASGRAIMASQQGGMTQIADLLDSLRHLDKRVFRAIWARIRQHWTAPMWIRVTDDERNVRFAPLNGMVDPQTGRPGPMVAQLDTDIIIDDAPDTIAPAIEQFQQLVELRKSDPEGSGITGRDIIEAAPNLRNKDKILQRMEEREKAAQQQGPQRPPEVMAMQAKMQLEQQAKQQQMAMEQQEAEARRQERMKEMEFEFHLQERKAQREIEIAIWKAQQEALLKRQIAEEDAATRREVARMTASQRPDGGATQDRTFQ